MSKLKIPDRSFLRAFELTDENFSSLVLESHRPFLINFYSDWCPLCPKFTETVHNVANMSEFQGWLQLGLMNIQDHPSVGTAIGLRILPSLAIFRSGKLSAHKSGIMPRREIVDFINHALR
ncbi:MAG: hypothetical protein KDI61_11640 [Alphaproteobacteria bacterium]|nr:hypothetical protein [Alphaproteobacteria bacterium]